MSFALTRNLSVQWIFSWKISLSVLVGLGTSLNQIAYIDQLAEHEIVQCCELLVELGGIGALGVVRTSPQIIHVVTFQPPVLDAVCQQRNISQLRTHSVTRYSEQLKRHEFTESKEEIYCFGILVLLHGQCLPCNNSFTRWKYSNDNSKLTPLLSKPSKPSCACHWAFKFQTQSSN